MNDKKIGAGKCQDGPLVGRMYAGFYREQQTSGSKSDESDGIVLC